ncbi:MAG: RDD family protein [Spirochaetes bacterium]|nr:RDD family protein [Spirochaetota bacterium]
MDKKKGSKKVGFLVRFLAFIIDVFIVGFINMFLFFLVMIISYLIIRDFELYKMIFIKNLIPIILGTLFISTWTIYYICLLKRFGVTIGGSVFRLQIINQDFTLGLSYRTVVLRYLGFLLTVISCGIGGLLILFNKEKKSLQDYIAKTYVVFR